MKTNRKRGFVDARSRNDKQCHRYTENLMEVKMPKCTITGVEIALGSAYALDVSETHRALRDLRDRAAALEKLLSQLGRMNKVEVLDHKTGKAFERLDAPLVSQGVAEALSQGCPGRRLFVPYPEWKELRRKRRAGLLHRDEKVVRNMVVEDSSSPQAPAVSDALTGSGPPREP